MTNNRKPTTNAKPGDYSLVPIFEGAEYTQGVEGGFVRRQAPCDGMVVEKEDDTTFVRAADLKLVLERLGYQVIPPAAQQRESP